jgi:hypothetical protein
MQYIYFDAQHTKTWHPKGIFQDVVQQAGNADVDLPSGLLDFHDQSSYLRWTDDWKSQYEILAVEQAALLRLLSTSHIPGEQQSQAHRLKVRYRRMLTALIVLRHAAKHRVAKLRSVPV